MLNFARGSIQQAKLSSLYYQQRQSIKLLHFKQQFNPLHTDFYRYWCAKYICQKNSFMFYISFLTLICIKYFCSFTVWNRFLGTHKWNAELTRQNGFFSTFQMKLVYFLTRETLTCNSLIKKKCVFLQKETSHSRNNVALGPQGSKSYVFGDLFYSKNARVLKFHVFLLFHV